MKIVIIDKLGLCYDGTTLSKHGLGGSESAVILIAKELSNIGFDVTVVNNCIDGAHSSNGIYDGVRYIDNKDAHQHYEIYDAAIVSRSVRPFLENSAYPFIPTATKRILWLHDTFIDGDQIVENLIVSGVIHHVFTLSDFHTNYILNCDHGARRNFEVLKKYIFQTRNGAVTYLPEVDLNKKNRNHFVFNASSTKGLLPLVDRIWPLIKQQLPNAHLTVIGGFYRFREGAAPDQQQTVVQQYAERQDLKDLDVTFTGVVPQRRVAEILANAYMMLYPGAFPETFGISTLESLLYNTPLVTTRFGALEETAIADACFFIDYAIEPNSLFPNINIDSQVKLFVEKVIEVYNNPYLYQQKQNACNVVKDIAGWDSVARQWQQFLYKVTDRFLSANQYREVTRINNKIARVFGRTFTMPVSKEYRSFGNQKKIAIISPFWNAENYIERHIQSVAQQDYENYVHIIIDDASTDNSIEVIKKCIDSLPENSKQKITLLKNDKNQGAIFNQLETINRYVDEDTIVMLLDGDDWLVNNNTIFHYYNDLYDQDYEFTYGSMWSVVDNIPLIAQSYPEDVKQNKTYRNYLFNWKIPYTHLRTCKSKYFNTLNRDKFKDSTGNWMKSGADNPLFYELIEQVPADKIFCNTEIVCNYNDANPLNDYKIRGEEQNDNAALSYKKEEKVIKTILVAIPTNKGIEPDTFKSIFDLRVPDGYKLDFQYFYGYQIDQIRNLIADWGKRYDYLFCVDSDIVLPHDCIEKMIAADKDIISGLYIQRIPGTQILEIYKDSNNGVTNQQFEDIKDLGVFQIAACGMGCCLIKSEVLRKIEYPHFVYKSALDHAHTFSEDIYFCCKARGVGFTVWADSTIRCEHIGQTKFLLPAVEPVTQIPVKSDLVTEVANMDMLPVEHAEYLKTMNINPKIVYDIGACVLHWTRKAKEAWPTAQYFLFDANEKVEPIMKASGDPYWIDLLTDVDGKELIFYKKENNLSGNSYYKENTEHFSYSDGVPTIGWTLDGIVSDNQWPLPDLIKLDVQGAEIDILKGAKKCLLQCNDIILEAQHVDYNAGAPKDVEVFKFMETIGYELVSRITYGRIDSDFHFRKKSIN
jgi:FkbM family methyltransferase